MKSSLKRWLVLSVSMLFVILIGVSQTAYATDYTYNLAPGESARVSSKDGRTVTVHVNGLTFDYATTSYSRGANGYGKGTKSSTHSVKNEERLILTNTSNEFVTIASDQNKSDIVRSKSPALVSTRLQPGESAEVTNIGITDEYFYVGGKNDHADYDEYNMLQFYKADHTGGQMVLEIAKKIAITNRDEEAIEVYAPHSYFKIESRQQPAVFHRYIEPNKTLEINNVSDNIYYVYFDVAQGTMQYDYVSYLNNEIDRYGSSSDSSRQIGKIKYVVTNKEVEPLHVYGPYEAFALYERDDFALETKSLKQGESMQIINTSVQSHSLNFKGTYEFAEYDSYGNVVDFDKGVLSSSKSIDAGTKIIISNSSVESVEIIGPKDVLQYETIFYPALIVNNHKQLVSFDESSVIGETAKVRNKTNNPFIATADSAADSEQGVVDLTKQTVRADNNILRDDGRGHDVQNGLTKGNDRDRITSYPSVNEGQRIAVMNDS
ncbi:hypothetical protein NQ117_16845 [Paenibacillus sp. SC116]|uniref:hypothetical protein n=1 Tax=Paenibacillus sp. SC116 TaxID=2968986 RepID=UPI00215A97E2|nr:hypothetical protein [Paenibacillus sp. SC116]MCR8845351.1 hypothetical protein [Paenibacillus sp. SC116]